MVNKMNGLEISKLYFETYGLPMLKEKFPELLNRISVGLVGHGSECFGYDDLVSRDHDFEPGFTMWLSEEDEKLYGFKLMRAYNNLPKEFMDVKLEKQSLLGNSSKGVHTVVEFCKYYFGTPFVPKTLDHWLSIPDFYLAEALNGEIFLDNALVFTNLRKEIKERPTDVKLKKLASNIFLMCQSGQYNYERCIKHHEMGSAILSLNDFVKHTISVIYLLNDEYEPYYKWVFRKMDELHVLSNLKEKILSLLNNPTNYRENILLIEEISTNIINELANQNLSNLHSNYLEQHAYEVNNCIKDANLRNSSIII